MEAWFLVCDQWRMAPMGGVIGMDWSAVKVLLDADGINLDPPLVQQLRAMERAAMRVLTKKQN